MKPIRTFMVILSLPGSLEARGMKALANGPSICEASVAPCQGSGLHGYTLRVLPNHPALTTSFQHGLITWAPADSNTSEIT